MKTSFIIILITIVVLSFLVGLNGCATGTFRLRITPMKVEINPPEKEIPPDIQPPIELIPQKQ